MVMGSAPQPPNHNINKIHVETENYQFDSSTVGIAEYPHADLYPRSGTD
jgi:hypothetical protein